MFMVVSKFEAQRLVHLTIVINPQGPASYSESQILVISRGKNRMLMMTHVSISELPIK